MTFPEPCTRRKLLTALTVIVLLYIFVCGIKLMGGGCKAMKDHHFVKELIEGASNPFIALLVGVVVTSVIQSSSATTSIVVGLVATGVLTVHNAIPIIMGANIGTTVTNVLVSMGYVTRKDEFQRAASGAIVHDIFNLIVVAILLPLELLFNCLENAAAWLTGVLPPIGPGSAGVKALNPLGPLLKPVLDLVESIVGKPEGPGWVAGITALVGLVFVFFALIMLVKVLRSVMLGRAETFISRVLGKSGWMGIVIGLVVTAMVQSSSITTSVLVPMAAAGIVTVTQIFPITIGANIGTTVTALIAALAAGGAGVTIAIVHCLFNIFGMLLFYPIPAIRRLPVAAAERIGAFAANSRKLALVYVFAVFYGVPALLIFVHRLFSGGT
ncbi:MAG: Na/Pi symporter [Planctomycetota bacterium]